MVYVSLTCHYILHYRIGLYVCVSLLLYRRIVISRGRIIPNSRSLAVFDDFIFWTDQTRQSALRVTKRNIASQADVTTIFHNSSTVFGSVKVLHKSLKDSTGHGTLIVVYTHS